MVEKGTKFTFNGKLAKALEYMPFVGLWFCVYEEDEGYFYLFPEEIEKSRKESDKNKMKLEYKFYEKNLAPKWLEGDYDLHIEGNRMVMTSKDGKKVEARCHPEDDWRLQVGIDELKKRMSETKKPREIKVGDKVKFKHDNVDWYCPHTVSDWCKTNHISIDYVMTAYASDIIFGDRENELEDYKFRVVTVNKYKNKTLAYIMAVAILDTGNKYYGFIVNTEKLELVE